MSLTVCSSRNIEVHREYEALSQHAAGMFAELCRESIADQGCFMAGLSGGSSPIGMYETIAAREHDIAWENTHLYLCDERHVPMESPDSNFRKIREVLMSRVPIPPGNVYRFMSEWPDPAKAAALYEDQVRVAFRTRGLVSDPTPQFDLLVLGMGTDGHTASIFPGSETFATRGRTAMAVRVAKLSAWRMTMTPSVILSAKHVVMIVSGQSKAVTLEAVLNGPFDPVRYPAQICLKRAENTTWLLDEAAASRLSKTD